MLDESITSSPSKSNKSIHKVRLIRKNKRKKIEDNIHNSDDKKETNVDISLYDFYKHSEDESDDAVYKNRNDTFLVSKPSAIIENYKPFEMEKRLAMADRLTSNQRDEKNVNEFPENQGFSTCQTIKQLYGLPLTKQESSFLITESELINCCYQAEKVFEEKEPVLQKHEMELLNSLEGEVSSSSLKIQPSSPMQLVNSILKDFSQSPITKDQSVIYTSWQHTPEFRLRRKPVKTYSRKCLNRTRTNLTKRLESVTSDGGNSNCSSISIQENVAPLEGVFNSSITDTSERLCLNLLNLSAFFTQNSSSNSSQDQNDQNSSETFLLTSSQERLLKNISSITHEIFKYRSSCPDKLRTNSYSSNQDFFGFPSHKEEEEDTNVIDLVVENKHAHLNNTLIEDVLPLEEQKIYINSDGNGAYNNWIDDGCEGVFVRINTDAISFQNDGSISDQTSHKLPKTNEQLIELPEFLENYGEILTNVSLKHTQSSTKFMGFKTASSKTIKVSREAHIMAAKILSKLPDIPNKSKINNYDSRAVKKDSTTKDVNIFGNQDDYEWNDDCDFFMNFKTPDVLNEKQNIQEIVKEKFSYTNDFPSTSKMAMKANMGFQTAGGKNVAISKKAQQSVQTLLKQFETEIIANEDSDLKEIKMKIYTKTHNVKTQKTNLKNKEVNGNQQCNRNEILIKNFVTNNNLNVSHDKESSNLADILDKRDTNDTNPRYEFSNFQKGNMGFQTAQCENINISTKAQQSGEKLLKELVMDSNEHFECDLSEIKDKTRSNVSKSITEMQTVYGEQIKVSTNALQCLELVKEKTNNQEISRDCDIEIQQQNFAQNSLNEMNDFQTANGKKVLISAKAQQCVEHLLKEFNADFKDDIFEDLQTIKNAIKSKCNRTEAEQKFEEVSDDLANIMLSEWPLSNNTLLADPEQKKDETISTGLLNERDEYHINDNNSKTLNNCDIEISSNIGFQTAKGNKVSISAKAQQAVDKLLQEFRSDLTTTNNEQSLMDLKSKIETKNLQLKQHSKYLDLKSTQNINEHSNMIFSEWPLNSKIDLTQISTPKQIMGKRKLSLDNSDIPSPITVRSPPTKIINKGLYSTKSSFNEFTIKSPLNSSPASAVISRKNLLSLTKRRKNKRNSVTNVNQDSNEKEIPKIYKELVETPIKSSSRTSIQTPATPNLKEFFSNAPQSSTPKEEQKLSKSAHKSLDIDFKPINWDTINDTAAVNKSKFVMANRSTKLSDSTCSNITLNSPNPTAKERIARLKMYGKPPAVSPILIDTHNSCRPSGLRRTRSMLKKTENK